MTEKKDNQLTIAVKKSGLQPSKVDSLLQSFAGYFDQAKELTGSSRSIVVTDEAQTDLMIKARESRLKLKDIRINVEKTRKELKEQSLREGRAIDGVANIIKALIVPVEEHLEKQEKYSETKELERIEKRHSERITKLSVYVEDVTFYSLKSMSDDAFNKLLASSKAIWDNEIALKKKNEEIRLAEEKKERLGRAIIEQENKKLKAQAEEREKKIAEEKKANDLKLAEEKRKTEAAEAKLKAEKEAQKKREREARELEEARKKAEDELLRATLLAPDKEKLIEFAGSIDKLQAPNLASREAGLILNEALNKLNEISNNIREKSKTL